MKAEYHEESDMLYIGLSTTPSTESEELTEGFVFDFGPDGRVVGIEVEQASRRVDLSDIKTGEAMQVRELPESVYTVGLISREFGVSPRAVQKSIRSMTEAGIEVGHRPGGSRSLILREDDVNRIKRWRAAHKPGRPAKGS